MPDNPELVSATDLDQWASRLEAKGLLPRLVRRLLTCTPGISGVSIRAGEGIGVPGWDGRAQGSIPSAYVPAGLSVWEMGTDACPRAKAQKDYRKRTDDQKGVVAASTSFVFVTPRRWGAKVPEGKRGPENDKAAWVHNKQAEGIWKDVIALDADDLEGWLEATPAVHIWISEKLGRRPLEVQTLERWWESWLAQTKPALPAGLLLAGRRVEAEKLRDLLAAAPDVIGLYAASRDEAIAFLAAALLVPDELATYIPGENPLASILVVSTTLEWARLAQSPAHAVLVPGFEGADVASATRNGHHVVVPMRGGDDQSRAKLVLPRLARDESRDVLFAAGWSFEKADREAAHARRSLKSLRRVIAKNPALAHPDWAQSPASDSLTPLVLVSGWSAASAPDREIVAEVTGLDYDTLERDLVGWSASDDPPFRRSGTDWYLAAPLDAWTLLRQFLTSGDLARWQTAALQVLSEVDPSLDLPAEKRPFARIRGATRSWSDELRRGLAGGVALLGGVDNSSLPDGRTGPDHASSLVRELLGRANGDETARIWQTLADVLPLLAEAAPKQFLDAARVGLDGDAPLLRLMFTDSKESSSWAASSPHTGLLCALETLCWEPEYLSRAADALARLAQVDPGGSLSNRPSQSLTAVLLPSLPGTRALLNQRLQVTDGISDRIPDVGWPLLLSLLPTMNGISFDTCSPLFRDWKPETEGVPIDEYREAVRELVDRTLNAVAQHPARWVQLVHQLRDLPPEELDRCLSVLEALPADALDHRERRALWNALCELVANHRQFKTANWALPDEPLQRLEAIAARFEPAGAVDRLVRLFDRRLYLPGIDNFDRTSYDKAIQGARLDGIREVLDDGGPDALVRLAEECKFPRLVGAAVADVTGDSLTPRLLAWLTVEGPRREVAIGFVLRMSENPGWAWIDRTAVEAATLPETARGVYYLSLPNEPRTWALVDSDTQAVQDQYWNFVDTLRVSGTDAASLAEHLLNHRRPRSAIDLLALHCHGGSVLPLSNRELVERALLAGAAESSAEGPLTAYAAYNIGVLVDCLGRSGSSQDTLFRLEWAYFLLLNNTREPGAIYTQLATRPQLFVEVVCAVCRGEHEAKVEQGVGTQAARKANLCFSVLRSWRALPGASGGVVDRKKLRDWVDLARQLLAKSDRLAVGDVFIGELLSGSPSGDDGAWPAEPVRDLIEDLESEKLETGLFTGTLNSRGVTMRGAYDGGKQEVALVDQYRIWADRVEDKWPRTGRVLRDLSESYAKEAHYHDESAERLADEG